MGCGAIGRLSQKSDMIISPFLKEIGGMNCTGRKSLEVLVLAPGPGSMSSQHRPQTPHASSLAAAGASLRPSCSTAGAFGLPAHTVPHPATPHTPGSSLCLTLCPTECPGNALPPRSPESSSVLRGTSPERAQSSETGAEEEVSHWWREALV